MIGADRPPARECGTVRRAEASRSHAGNPVERLGQQRIERRIGDGCVHPRLALATEYALLSGDSRNAAPHERME